MPLTPKDPKPATSPEEQARIDEIHARWKKIAEDLSRPVDESTRITGKDLQITITPPRDGAW